MSANDRLHKLLSEQHDGPFTYHFKFVLPVSSTEKFSKLLPGTSLTSRLSANAKFVSFSFDFAANTPQDVIDIYQRVQSVPGLISL